MILNMIATPTIKYNGNQFREYLPEKTQLVDIKNIPEHEPMITRDRIKFLNNHFFNMLTFDFAQFQRVDDVLTGDIYLVLENAEVKAKLETLKKQPILTVLESFEIDFLEEELERSKTWEYWENYQVRKDLETLVNKG